jgi:hypothetical protein
MPTQAEHVAALLRQAAKLLPASPSPRYRLGAPSERDRQAAYSDARLGRDRRHSEGARGGRRPGKRGEPDD